MNLSVLGVDPGVRGGLAVLAPDGSVAFLKSFRPDMPEHEFISSLSVASELLKTFEGRDCFMEKVGYVPSDGGQGAFTFGKVYGMLRGALLMQGLILHDVYPQMWQSALECLSGGNKNVTKKRAQEIFPFEKITHATADALLIAQFGRERLARQL